jgi:hypothetical protein
VLALKAHVSSVFICLRGMLHGFYMDVAKVDWNIAYVAVLYTMLQIFVPNVLSIFSDICCKCVYMNVAYVLRICCKSFI